MLHWTKRPVNSWKEDASFSAKNILTKKTNASFVYEVWQPFALTHWCEVKVATLTRRITSRMRAFLAVFFFFLYSSFKPQSSMWEHLILAQSSQANPSQGGARFQTSSFQAHCTPTLIPDGSSASGFYPSALSMFGFIPLFSRWGQEIDTTGKCSSCRVFFILFTFLIWPS